MIIVDSREKKWEHIKTYFDSHNIEYVFPKKLEEGDYYNTDNPGIVIDRKANLQEVCNNLMNGKSNRTRFANECKRAMRKQIRFVVLIEGTNCRNTSDVKTWKSKYSKHTGFWLCNEMFKLTAAYQVEWVFCRRNETAKKILELLAYDS